MEKKQTQTSEAFLNKIKADGVSIIDGSSFDRFEDKNIINSDIPFGGDMREYGYALDNIYGDFERFYSQGKKPPEKDFNTGRKIHETFQEAVEMQFPKKDGGHYTEAEMTEWETVFERYEKEGHVPDSNNYGFNHFDAEVGSKKVLAQIMELQTGEPYVLAELKGINQGEEVIAVIPENLYSDEYVKSLETEYLNFNGAERGTEKAVEGYVSTPARYEIIFDIMANNNCRLEFGALNGDMAEAFITGNASNDEILRFSYDEKSDVDFAQKLIEKANSLSLLDSPHTKLVRKIANEIAKEYEKELFQENEKMIPARSDNGNASEYDFRDKINELAKMHDNAKNLARRIVSGQNPNPNIEHLDEGQIQELENELELNYVPYEFKTEKCLEFAEMKKLLKEKHEVTFGEIENRNASDANKEPDYYLNMQFYSDLGEDFNTTIELGDTISPESLADGISDAYESFDVDKHVEMWIEAKNKNVRDVPQSISNLVEDAKSIDKKLQNIDKDAARLNWQHSNGRTMALEEPKKETPSVNATPFERVAENVKKTLAKDGNDINAMSTTTIMTAFAKSIQALSQKDKEMFSRQLIEMGGISKGAVEKLILKAAGKEITKENKKLRDDYGIGR